MAIDLTSGTAFLILKSGYIIGPFGVATSLFSDFGLKVELFRFGCQFTITYGEAIAFSGDIHISSALKSESGSLILILLSSDIFVLFLFTS